MNRHIIESQNINVFIFDSISKVITMGGYGGDTERQNYSFNSKLELFFLNFIKDKKELKNEEYRTFLKRVV